MREIAKIKHIVTLKPHSIVKCDRWENPFTNSEVSRLNLLQKSEKGYLYNGYLSPSTRRNIKKRLEVWLTAIEMNVDLKNPKLGVGFQRVFPTFVTLTLPSKQCHSDQTIKKYCLEPFLKWASYSGKEVYKYGARKGEVKSFGVRHYFWRAETQENGNIHFHILVDKFIPWERIREKWNELIESLGYVTRYGYMQEMYYEDGFKLRKRQFKQDLNRFEKLVDFTIAKNKLPKVVPELIKRDLEKCIKSGEPVNIKRLKYLARKNQAIHYKNGMKNGFKNPNTTDIHGIKNLQSITAYVIKYVCKPPKEEDIILASDEKIIEENGKKFKVKYYLDKDINKPDWATEEIEIDREEYVPIYVTRKLRGKIWGTDKGLKPKEGQSQIDYYKQEESITTLFEREEQRCKIVLEKDEIVKEERGLKKVYKVETNIDLFGIEHRSFIFQREYIEKAKVKEPKMTVEKVYNYEIHDYIKVLKQYSDSREIERIKVLLGEHFERINGEVIPLRNLFSDNQRYLRQDEVLKRLSPQIYTKYKMHYTNIFETLYNTAA